MERKVKAPAARAVPAATRTVAILRLLAGHAEALSLSEIAAALDLIPSTALHILRVLVAERMVSVDARTKKYRLDVGVLGLARAVLRQSELTTLIKPEIDALSSRYAVSTTLSELRADRAIIMAVSHPAQLIRFNVEVGSRFPAGMGATGRCYAAFGDIEPTEIAGRLNQWSWARQPDPIIWLSEVEACRKKGFALDRGNYIAGVTAIAAPILNSDGRLTHVVGTIGLTDDTKRIGEARIGRELITIAQRVAPPHHS